MSLKLKMQESIFFLSLVRSAINVLLPFSKDRIKLMLDAFSDHTLPFWSTVYSWIPQL